MPSIILDGKTLAKKEELRMQKEVETLLKSQGPRPKLATVLVGADPASATYVKMKGNAARRVGIETVAIHMDSTTTTDQLLSQLKTLNDDSTVHGILLQHPLPPSCDTRVCFDAINPEKDVDGVTSHGFGKMAMGESAWGSCTPAGIMHLLREYDVSLSGLDTIVVGRSPILGKPMAAMLTQADATVTLAHSKTKNLPEKIGRADLVVAAVGIPKMIQSDWLKHGCILVDAGYHPAEKCGDVESTNLTDICAAHTPVPGGVGPMTISTLLSQTLQATKLAHENT